MEKIQAILGKSRSKKRQLSVAQSPPPTTGKRQRVDDDEQENQGTAGTNDNEVKGASPELLLGQLPLRTRGDMEEHGEAVRTAVREASKVQSNKDEPRQKSRHVRFGSQDPEITLKTDTAPTLTPHAEPDSDSDDAPEAESLKTAQSDAKLVEAKAAKAVNELEARKKSKRKQRDAQLKQQAESTHLKKKQKLSKREAAARSSDNDYYKDGDDASKDSDEPMADGDTPATKPFKFDRSSIPALLPDELLAIEPAERSPTPPPGAGVAAHGAEKRPRKIRFSDAAPADVRRGPVKVRVLEKSADYLTPKSGQFSKSLKLNWLYGRTGRGGAKVPRRKKKVGFVRRR
ncbi:MAG: hypothetical protein M1825_001512 [Sarcosagium campestre]|nr:MAG: hypothetical protein M1825_001512 [Sarcosagium campestre]